MADIYKIYQLHDTPEYHGIRFASMAENKNENLNIRDYDLVYQGNISDFSSENLLEAIYRKFNLDRPEDFRGHSLAMSDVVVTEINDEQKAYYCDRIGFQEMPEFFAEQSKWINYSANYDMKIDDEYIEGLTGKENILANGGVFFRATERKNEFEYAAVIIEDNNTPFPCHGYINLDDYRDDKEFIQYAEEENMTVDELIHTGAFAASWILENNADEFVFTANRDKDAGQFIDEMGLLKENEEENSFDYETAFEEIINNMEFSLVKNEDNTFSLHDDTGANLGGIESERFTNAVEILDRLTYNTYYEDYFYTGASESIEEEVKTGEIKIAENAVIPEPEDSAEKWKEFLEENDLTERYSEVYAVSRLLADTETININLDNIPHDDYERDFGQIEYEQ